QAKPAALVSDHFERISFTNDRARLLNSWSSRGISLGLIRTSSHFNGGGSCAGFVVGACCSNVTGGSGGNGSVLLGPGMRRHTLTMVTSSLPLRYTFSVYSTLWPPLSIRMLPTIVRSGRLTETPDQLLVFSCGQNL